MTQPLLLKLTHPLLLNASFIDTYVIGTTWVTKLIVLIIIGILLFSIRMFMQNRNRIEQERKNLFQLKGNLTKWKETIKTNGENEEDDPGASYRTSRGYEEDVRYVREASIHEDLMPGIASNTMVHERLRALEELRGTRSRVNVGVLQELSEIQDAKQLSSRLPSFAMSISMLLGMLGTFIGLTMMVGDITEQLQGFDDVTSADAGLETFRNSFKGIKDVMQGVGTAFITTLSGLVCTITVSFLNFAQVKHRAAFFDEFEQFTVKDLLPHTFPDMEQEEVINAIKDQLRETFDNLNRTFENNRKTLSTVDGLYGKFDAMVSTVKDVMDKGGTAELQNVLTQMNDVNHNLETIIDKYENRKLLDDFHKVADKYDGYLEKHDFILEQSKWLPNARLFMGIISGLLGGIMIVLSIIAFS